MKTLALSLPVALLSAVLTFYSPIPQPTQKSAPTKLAKFDMGAYVAKAGTTLRVNVDKQLGGEVDVQLKDAKGTICFQRTLGPQETQIRLVMDLTELKDGDYLLKVTNGLEMMVRDVKVSTQRPATITRSITFQ